MASVELLGKEGRPLVCVSGRRRGGGKTSGALVCVREEAVEVSLRWAWSVFFFSVLQNLYYYARLYF